MEEIRTTTSEIEDLVTLLLVQKESLEGQGVDISKWPISKTLIAIKQLNKKLDTILDSETPKTLEELEAEVCKNE
jgi:hypothetical protein